MINLVVSEKYQVSSDTVCIVLTDPDGDLLPPFTAGAHVDIELGEGLTRQYSLWNSSHERHRYCLGVALVADSRGGSRAVHDLQLGMSVAVSAPRNLFPLVEAEHITLVACGIGITPILAMADELHRGGKSFTLHYRLRSVEGGAFVDYLQSTAYANHVVFHPSDAMPTASFDFSTLLATDARDRRIYVCGPAGFTDALREAAVKAGVHETHFHQELFAAEKTILERDDTFVVHFSQSGVTTTVPPGVSVAEAARAAGVALPTSCGQGICGTCLVNVLAGVPDHRDDYLTPSERDANNQMLTCCSRSKTKELTLDL